MLISGVQKFTMLDFPEQTACILFTPGCNFRCGYCHNPEFVIPEKIKQIRDTFIPEESFFAFLETRKELLDGVVISGGEPTLMPDLIWFMTRVKDMGFKVKLDTNGNRPEVIKEALEKKLVDFIAMDIKTSPSCYESLVGKQVNVENLKKSITLIMESGIDYEFRSTLIKEIHNQETLESMGKMIQGAKILHLQPFRPEHTLNPSFELKHPFSAQEMKDVAKVFSKFVQTVEIRS